MDSYTGSNLDADVAYDTFLSSSPSAEHEYEVMIWLAALGPAGPISSSGSPIATTSLAGVRWKLYSGMNGSMRVYSFVAENEARSFSGDLMDFFGYLQDNQGLSGSLYLTDVQAGTEPFTGADARLTTRAYNVRVE